MKATYAVKEIKFDFRLDGAIWVEFVMESGAKTRPMFVGSDIRKGDTVSLSFSGDHGVKLAEMMG